MNLNVNRKLLLFLDFLTKKSKNIYKNIGKYKGIMPRHQIASIKKISVL